MRKNYKTINEFTPRNATMKYCFSNVGGMNKLIKHLTEILDEVEYATSIASLVEQGDLSNATMHAAISQNLEELCLTLDNARADLRVLVEDGFCSPSERQNALTEREQCVKAGKCNGECKKCNEGWANVGDCPCNITGSNTHKIILEVSK